MHVRQPLTLWTLLLVWAAVAASAVAWGLAVFGAERAVQVSPNVRLALPGTPTADWSRVLGAEAPSAPAAAAAPAVAESGRFKLVGVIAASTPGAGFKGLAVIVLDEKPARAFRLGEEIEPDRALKEVSLRGVAIGPREGAAVIRLALATPAPAATGTLPSAFSGAGSGAKPPVLPQAALPLPRPTTALPPAAFAPAEAPSTMAVPPNVTGLDGMPRPTRPGGGGARLELSSPDFPTGSPVNQPPADSSAAPAQPVPSAAPRADR